MNFTSRWQSTDWRSHENEQELKNFPVYHFNRVLASPQTPDINNVPEQRRSAWQDQRW